MMPTTGGGVVKILELLACPRILRVNYQYAFLKDGYHNWTLQPRIELSK